MNEVWKAIPGFEGLYEVSDLGRVRSLDRYEEIANRWGSATRRLRRGQMLAAYVNHKRGGYRYVNLHVDGSQFMRRVAVLVASAFLGVPPAMQEVRHRDGVATHDSATNICYGTKKENAADRVLHGTQLRGSTHPSARLCEKEVLVIRERAEDETHAALAEAFGVSQQHVTNIVLRKRWAHV